MSLRVCLIALYEPEQQVVLSGNVRVSQKDRVVSSERVAIDLSKVRWVTPTPRCAD
jgi:lipopolysaccharide export system protein LptA